MTTTAPPVAAPPGVLAGQILQRFGQVLARYRKAVPGLDCPVARRWQDATGSNLADFPAWLAAMNPQRALVKVTKLLNAPLSCTDPPMLAEPGAEVLLQMALLALVHLLAQRYATPLKAASGPLLHLPMLADTVLALLVACRYGVAVHLAVRYDSQGREQLVVTNLVTDREEVQVGVRGVQDNIDTERKRLLLAQQVQQRVLPQGSGVLAHRLADDQLRAWVDDAADDDDCSLSPIVVLAWDEAEVARDIEQRWGVRTALRGDPASAPADSPQRAMALQFADAGQQVEPYFADLARLLRPAVVAKPLQQPSKPVVFISYAHKDEALMQRLSLALRQFSAEVLTWTDRELRPGDNWDEMLDSRLRICQVAVLLLSLDFHGSDYIRDKELPIIQRRHAAGQLRVVPVFAGPCRRETHSWVSALQFVDIAEDALFQANAAARDAALNTIAADIAQLVNQPAKDTPA